MGPPATARVEAGGRDAGELSTDGLGAVALGAAAGGLSVVADPVELAVGAPAPAGGLAATEELDAITAADAPWSRTGVPDREKKKMPPAITATSATTPPTASTVDPPLPAAAAAPVADPERAVECDEATCCEAVRFGALCCEPVWPAACA